MTSEIELSIVMPCLDEADAIAACIREATAALREARVAGEIASRLGARVMLVPKRGCGNALPGGIAAARGRYILMADSDASYDLAEAPRLSLAAPRHARLLIAAGRCISVDHRVHHSTKEIPPCMATGEAAGIAAAMAAANRIRLRNVPVAELRKRLQERGAIVDRP